MDFKEDTQIWECKVVTKDIDLPPGCDSPPRQAAISAIESLGFEVLGCASGWSATLSKMQKRLLHKDDQIAFLWKLLDDISTAGDVYKPEINSYFKRVEKSCSERGVVANSFDGQTITINEPKI